MISIYSIYNNVSGWIYIGQSKTIDKRRTEHFRNLRQGKHHNPILQNSYDKHGLNAFEFTEIEKHDTGEGADEAEIFLIDYLKFLGAKLFNLRDGGFLSYRTMTAETRAKLSKAHSGFRHTEEAKEVIRAAMVGRQFSASTRQKISDALKGRVPSYACRAAALLYNMGRKASDATKAKHSASSKGRPMSANARTALRAANVGRPKSSAHKLQISKTLKALFAKLKISKSPEAIHGQTA